MPLREKLKKVEKGRKVRPPREWWRKVRKEVREQYPTYLPKRINKITAGIWHRYPKYKKIEIIKDSIAKRDKRKLRDVM